MWSHSAVRNVLKVLSPCSWHLGTLKPLREASGEGLSLKFGGRADRIPEKSDSESDIFLKITLLFSISFPQIGGTDFLK